MNAGATPEGPGKSLRVFVSSPFCEPAQVRWQLRDKLRSRLADLGHKPWLYEIESKKCESTGLAPTEIILRGLRCCDLVVTVYKSRAGSFLIDEPFLATPYETIHARRLGKPVYLYILGNRHQPRLHSVLNVFEGTRVLPDSVERHETEDELVEAVLSDVAAYAADLKSEQRKILLPDGPSDSVNDSIWLDAVRRRLATDPLKQDLWEARNAVGTVPILDSTSGISRENKFMYASVLSACAGVLANQAEYDEAAACGWLAVRLFMELGYLYEMVAQIQAVSGILNMGNRTNRAYWVNTFGYQSAYRLRSDQFRSLGPAFSDSRGSILRKFGKFSGARAQLRKALPVTSEGSPYSLSKYAVALAATRTTDRIDTALRLMFEVALPLAISRGESLGYVKRDAASLAIAVGDYRKAKTLLAEAEQSCQKRGQLHTLTGVRQLKVYLALAKPEHSN